jgi:hypothetical protein
MHIAVVLAMYGEGNRDKLEEGVKEDLPNRSHLRHTRSSFQCPLLPLLRRDRYRRLLVITEASSSLQFLIYSYS